jgi:hypothetical protein
LSDELMRKAVEAAFRRLGIDADYAPAGGPARTVRIMFRSADEGYQPMGVAVRSENPLAEFLVSAVPELRTGDGLLVGGVTYRIGTPSHPDDRQLKWQAELTRA